MNFFLISRDNKPPEVGVSSAYLHIDHWNDYSYITMFFLSIHDSEGVFHNIGNIKIGFVGQDTSKDTYSVLNNTFQALPENFFSLGMDVGYYRKLSEFPVILREDLLTSLNDMVFNTDYIDLAKEEGVFRTSLLRDVSLSVLKGQFVRVLNGQPPLTDFEFIYQSPATERKSEVLIDFKVIAGSKPSTNIHALIGRNGVGKTTILNGMIEAITNREDSVGEFLDKQPWQTTTISDDYFSSLVSVSFSAFDPFTPPNEQPNPANGTCYFYIGLRENGAEQGESLKRLPDLHIEFIESLKLCLSQAGKTERWVNAIHSLESDENFAEMQLINLIEVDREELEEKALLLIQRMSSGHAVVLLTITKLVARVEEKTLLLIDEPESHLHPPLLSAFIQSLNGLLHDRNGVALIATHSPVVLQEVPKTCAWKINRVRLEMSLNRPEIETYGENVGTLTREIFGLEVVKSGFHKLLLESVARGSSYEDLLDEYDNQLGYEARAILKTLVLHRDRN